MRARVPRARSVVRQEQRAQRALIRSLLRPAAVSLLLVVLALLWWRVLGGTPGHCSAPSDGGAACPSPLPPSTVDVVTVALAPGCVAAASIASLNRFLNPKRLFVVARAPEACANFTRLAPNVVCLLDDQVLPGVSRSAVASLLQQRYGLRRGSGHSGRDTAGWYHQQLLKLGAVSYIPDLSLTFLLWDSDMVALRPIHIRDEQGRLRRQSGGSRVKTYAASYARLTGEPLQLAPDGSSFVTHQMVVQSRHMHHMLTAFEKSPPARCADGGEPRAAAMPRWAAAVLCSLDAKRLHLGFSEYASYASWVAKRDQGAVVVVPRGAWTRHPFDSKTAVVATRAARGAMGLCCPTRALLANAANRGWEYTGFEVGHMARLCSYSRQTHAKGYGHHTI